MLVTLFTRGISTRAALQALPAPNNDDTYVCAEVSAAYKFNSASVATADGWTVLAANDATPGRWELQGDTISLAPLGGTADDWPRLFGSGGVAAAMAYRGTIVLRPGTWLCKSVQSMPSGTRLRGSPGVTIVMSLAQDNNPDTAAFMREYNTAFTASTTLAAAASRGSFSIVTAASAPFAVGDIVRISNAGSTGNTAGFRVSTHTVIAVAGVNANLDRPLPRNYASGDNVRRIGTTANAASVMPQDIHIDGGGMTVTGTGVRVCEITGGRRCRVENIVVTDAQGVPTDLLFSYDLGGYDNHYSGIHISILGASNPVNGIAIESGDGCTIDRCTIIGPASVGVELYDCSDVIVSRVMAEACHPFAVSCGFALVTDTAVHDATTQGCIDCVLRDCVALNCYTGFQVRDGSLGSKLFGCVAEGNTSAGIYIGDSDGTVPDGTQIVSCAVRRNGAYGLQIGANAVRTKVRGLDFSNNGTSPSTGTGILAQGSLDAADIISSGGNGAQLITATGGIVRIARLTAIHTQVVNVILFSGTSRSSLTDSDLTFAAGSNGVNAGDVFYVSGVKVTGAANGLQVTGNVMTVGPNCDLSGCTTALLVSAGTAVVSQIGPTSKSITTADVTLTFAEGQSAAITTTGTLTGNRNLILPTVAGMVWDVFCNNSGAFTTTFKTASGTGIVVAQGKRARLQCDGTNIVRVSPDT